MMDEVSMLLKECWLISFCHLKNNKLQACIKFLLLKFGLLLQERLGEISGHDNVRAGRNDQPLSTDTQQSGQTELVQGGH